MSFSYAEPKRLLLGGGDIYLNNEWVGSLKGKVSLNYNATYAEQMPGNNLAPVQATRTKEEVTLTAEICDFKVEQLRRALGINQAIDSTAVAIRKRETLKLSGTVAVTTAETMSAGTLKISKLDRSTIYVSGTDYSASATQIVRKGAGAITAGDVVMVEYDFSDSGSKSVLVGGEQDAVNTFSVDFVHQMSTGKLIQVTLFKAYSMTNLTWAFSEKSSGAYTTYNITFKALVDITKKEGQNLFRITEEDGSATVN